MKAMSLLLALLTPIVCWCQSEPALETELNANPQDSLYGYMAVRVSDKVSESKPETLTRYKSNGLAYFDEAPHMIYHDFSAKMSALVKTNHDLEKRYQPHILFEFVGTMTYASTKAGVGFADRKDKFAIGGFYGIYTRRVDSYVRDFTARSHAWANGSLYGGYFQFEPEYFSCSLSAAIERDDDYTRIRLAWKLGKMIHSKIIPDGLRFEITSETFLGTGAGFAYRTSNGRMLLCASYLVPKRDEITKQRIFDRFLAQGVNLELQIIGF
jgi:hypothetical protein